MEKRTRREAWGGRERAEPRRWGVTALIAIFGVALPALALVVEAIWHVAAGIFFDPIPTLFHGLVVASVPLFNLGALRAMRWSGEPQRPERWLIGAGLMTGFSLIYAIPFVPVAPLSVIGILYYGLGLLGLAPITALLSTLVLWRRLGKVWRREHPAQLRPPRHGLAAVLGGVLVLTLAGLPHNLGVVAVTMINDEDVERQRWGIDLLRELEENALVEIPAPSGPTMRPDPVSMVINLADFVPLGRRLRLSSSSDPELYYRVTGERWQTRDSRRRGGPRWGFGNGVDDRPGEGDALADGEKEGLSLVFSHFDGSVDAEATTAYTEWTMVLQNDAGWQQEALMHVQLPPGAVVSRLTLWIDGEPQEAAFGGRGQVRRAYRSVVRERRDLVVVTTAGPDRVQLRAFPVPPNGGTMKLRLGITQPLRLGADQRRAWLHLPQITETDAAPAEGLEHDLLFESFQPLRSNLDVLTSNEGAVYRLSGRIPHEALAKAPPVRLDRIARVKEVFARGLLTEAPGFFRGTFEERRAGAPSHLIIVLDTSAAMAPHKDQILEALHKGLAGGPAKVEEVSLVVNSDAGAQWIARREPREDLVARFGAIGKRLDFEGGRDNGAPLRQAYAAAAEAGAGNAVLWVHGPQRLRLGEGDVHPIGSTVERLQAGAPPLYEIQLGGGLDVLVEDLDPSGVLRAVPRTTPDAAQDLVGFLTRWDARWWLAIEHVDGEPPAMHKETSRHLARLWAAGQVDHLIRTGARDAAKALAVRYQLVTPVSGAVVLERAEQYEEHGLRQADPSTVPSIPEPEEWALLAVALAVLVTGAWRRRRESLDFGAGGGPWSAA